MGVTYLRIEGVFYIGIGILFLLYALYRGLGRPEMSIVLTVASLGTRVALAYALSALPAVGLIGIWWSVPIGWGQISWACGTIAAGARRCCPSESMVLKRNGLFQRGRSFFACLQLFRQNCSHFFRSVLY